MRTRDPELSANWGTICTPVQMPAADDKMRKIQAANTEGLLRIINRPCFRDLSKKGYDTDWIHQRLLSIRVRNELTAEWQERGVQQGKEYIKQKETADQGPP